MPVTGTPSLTEFAYANDSAVITHTNTLHSHLESSAEGPCPKGRRCLRADQYTSSDPSTSLILKRLVLIGAPFVVMQLVAACLRCTTFSHERSPGVCLIRAVMGRVPRHMSLGCFGVSQCFCSTHPNYSRSESRSTIGGLERIIHLLQVYPANGILCWPWSGHQCCLGLSREGVLPHTFIRVYP